MGTGSDAKHEHSTGEVESVLRELKIKIEELQSENDRLKAEISDWPELTTKIEELQSENDRLKAEISDWAEIEELQSENDRLKAENSELQTRLESGVGATPGGSSGSGDHYKQLREKAEAQRKAKARRKKARLATKPVVRGRGKRSPRPPFVADETIVRDIPQEELPSDASPNGFVDRRFYGLRIARHNVLIRLREYISPTQGRLIAKLPEGWSGEFTPDSQVTINILNMGGMTEPRIKELFADHGVAISAGHVNGTLLKTAQMLDEERLAAHRAGVENSPVVGMDGTHTMCDGEPRVCHILGNDVFTSMTTTEHKDRVSVIGALAGQPAEHCVGEYALKHPDLSVAAREMLRKVHNGEPVRQGASLELVALSNELRTKGLDAPKMDEFLKQAMPSAKPDTLRNVREATVGQWLRTIFLYLPLVMLTDGGTNYHGILEILQLCWIHILRPFSQFAETNDSQRVLTDGWVLYHRICSFRANPNKEEAAKIEAEFDRVFDPQQCLDPHVKRQIDLTLKHKSQLLTVLSYPYVPAENNGQERAAKARVRKRDLSFGPRSAEGLKAWDTTQSVVGTLRKLRISPAAFIADRITRQHRFEPLDVLVKNACVKLYGPRADLTGTF